MYSDSTVTVAVSWFQVVVTALAAATTSIINTPSIAARMVSCHGGAGLAAKEGAYVTISA